MLVRGARRRAAVIASVEPSSPTDGRLTRTFAAAPRAAASPSSAATSRSLEALTLLRPASASASADELEAGLDASRAGPRRRAARPPLSAAVRAPRSSSVSRGSFIARGEPGVGRGVLVGEVEEPVARGRWPVADRPGVERGVLGVLRAALGQRATIATRPRRAPRRPPRRCRHPGTGSADASRPTNASSVRSRKRRSARGDLHAAIVRLRRARGTGARRRTASDADGSEPGRARYRRTRPASRRASASRGGPPSADGRDPSAGRRCDRRLRPRARTSSSRPVDRPAPGAMLVGERRAGPAASRPRTASAAR